MKYLITGAGGFIGSHLAEYLLAQNQSVMAAVRRRNDFLSSLRGNLEIECGDLLDSAFINRLFESYAPDIIFHLAAQSLPLSSWREPAQTFRTNLISSLKLFEAARRQRAAPLIIAASSSSVYASGQTGSLLNEEAPLQPGSIYAATKLAMEQLSQIFHEARGLKIICVRPFFIIGTRKTGDVSSDFARGIVRIERGEKNELPVGNLAAIRDFLDVRDAVSALALIAGHGKVGTVYNVCSGRGLSVGDLLAMFKKHAQADVRVVNDPVKIRPIDEAIKIGDPARLAALGWEQSVDMDSSVRAILDYWRGVS